MNCPVCHKEISITGKGVLRVHGPKAQRCAGSNTDPESALTQALEPEMHPEASQSTFRDWVPQDPEIAAKKAEIEAQIVKFRALPADTQHDEWDPPAAEASIPRPPASPCFTGEQHLDSLNATMVLGRRDVAAEMLAMLRRTTKLACDIESEGLDMLARNLKCVMFSDVPNGERVAILDPRDPVQYKLIRWVFEHTTEIVFHNAAFDVPNLAVNGLFDVAWCAKVTDTLLYGRLAEPSALVSKGLADCANRYLGLAYDAGGMKESARAVGIRSNAEMYRTFDLDRPVYVRGAASDAVVTARLLPAIRKAALTRLISGHPFADWGVQGTEAVRLIQREQRLNRMSLRRTVKGLRVDLEFLDRYNAQFGAELESQAAALTGAGIRPGVAQDLLARLQEWGVELPADYPVTEKTKLPSGQKGHLELINHDWARVFVSHKEKSKILHDYLEKVRDHAVTDEHGDERIRPVVNYLSATTGRASISGDPLHQFPGPARGVVLADPGDTFTSIDWSQIEPVVIANLAGQTDILAGYENGTVDFYTAVSQAAGIPRKAAKTQTLGSLYGQGLALTAAKLGVDIDEARRIRDAVFAPMPRVLELTQTLREIAEQHQLVPTVSGRIIPIPSGWYTNKRTGQKEWSVQSHKGVNYPTQGGAYDVLAESMIRAEEAGLGDAIYLSMHDELVVSSAAAHDIQKIMAQPPERLCLHSGRTPILRTDMMELGERWNVA